MMKIGILTWYFADNYGARAQCLALQQIIKKYCSDVEVISYIPPNGKLLNVKMCLSHPGFKLNPYYLARDLIRHFKFKNGLKLYNLTKKVYCADDVNTLGFDLVFLGSDAIFNFKHPLGNQLYYGVGLICNKATYSPSCEYIGTTETLSNKCLASLLQMSPVSVRDCNTAELLKHNGVNDTIVTLDPTFLYDFQEFNQRFKENNYILVYTFSDWNDYSISFREFANKKGLKIISVGRFCSWADKNYDYADLPLWISSFKKASYVITDSYHGLIFSIKNNKDLILLSREDKIDKIRCLLDQLGLDRKVYNNEESVEKYLSVPIMYDKVDSNILEIKNKCLDYIKEKIQAVDD